MKYYFDTDCLSAFLWSNALDILERLYGGSMIIPDQVYQELSNPRVPHLKKRTDAMIEKQSVALKTMETGTEEYQLYRRLIKGNTSNKAIGKGEAAAIVLAYTYKGVLASNNYRDIAFYIETYQLPHIDTGTILVEALHKKIITEPDGNAIWQRMLDRNRKLPAENFFEYLKKMRAVH